jgi:5-methylcytosine-specific restriction endonuclease McrA
MANLPALLRSAVTARAQGRCEYCHLSEEFGFASYEVDHVIAEQHGGETELENLAYACIMCNRRKGPNIASIDPDTRMITPLYNPRTQNWDEHFRLHEDGTITGLTAEGRATVRLLELDEPERVQERAALKR